MNIPELTLITPGNLSHTDAFLQTLDAALAGGVSQVIVREKSMDSARLLAFCAQVHTFTKAHQAKLIIHTQADIAQAIGADGVHVASHDIHEIKAMRTWLNHSHITISTSCHNLQELQYAHQMGADFAMLSPVFPTQSHPNAIALGIDTFHDIAKQSPLPIIALGGICQQNRVSLTGFPIAVIRAISESSDPKAAAQALLSA